MALAIDIRDPKREMLLNEVARYAIFFHPDGYGGRVRQYAGWAELIDDRLNICILGEYFDENNSLDPEVEHRLALREFRLQHRMYRVDGEDMVLLHGDMPAKV